MCPHADDFAQRSNIDLGINAHPFPPNGPPRMSPRLDAPIIIVGAGGSGSTLLDRTLGAHPDIEMKGEMKFLLADAWSAFGRADANTILRNQAQHFDADPGLESRIKADRDCHRAFLRRLEDEEFRRRGAVLTRTIAAWFCVDSSPARFWGFKEITNHGVHAWDPYDYVFPQAIWVHIVRHPLDHLHAAARLSGVRLSDENVSRLLANWVANVETSRQRAATGRYHEIKYEDLRAEPERALSSLLGAIGIRWHDECGFSIAQQWGERSKREPLPADIASRVTATAGLDRLMGEYGYYPQAVEALESASRSPSCMQRIGEGQWKLVGPFWRETANCWGIDLSDGEIDDQLRAAADEVGNWERSPLRLFENDKALGPSHELHFRIRRDGGGGYSHWQDRLLFSTSDNSSPNENGRTYHFDLAGQAGSAAPRN